MVLSTPYKGGVVCPGRNESKCDIRSVLKEGGIYIEGDQVGRIAEQEAGGMGLYEAQIAKRPDGDRGVRYQPDGGDQYALMGEAGCGECEVRY